MSVTITTSINIQKNISRRYNYIVLFIIDKLTDYAKSEMSTFVLL